MSKTIIYQLLPRLFFKKEGQQRPFGTIEENGCGKMNDITADVLKRIKQLGVTHIWYTGVIRHATLTDYSSYGIPRSHACIVKGKAGSPYAIADYYDVDPDLAVDVLQRKSEFEALIRRTHEAGLKVIIDFVPNHVAREYHSVCRPPEVTDIGETDDKDIAFSPENNFYYLPGEKFQPSFDIGTYHEYPAKATGNDRFDAHPGKDDWYETVKLNYGCPPLCTQLVAPLENPYGSTDDSHLPDTFQKMKHILRHWAEMGVDGFRCDMVHMIPITFWHWCIARLKSRYPELIFIGEVYQKELYRPLIGAGFDLLYDKAGMYEALISVAKDESSSHTITTAWQQTDDIATHMLHFLENHDEQRLASDKLLGDGEKALPLLAVAAWLRRESLMIYFGQEVGEEAAQSEGFSGNDGRTSIFDYWHVASASNAHFDRRRLTKKQKALLQQFIKILNLACTNKAITQGQMFDLGYVNPELVRHFAFFRKYKSQLLLCVVSFASAGTDTALNIPRHAFDYLGINEGTYTAVDLMDGCKMSLDLNAEHALNLHLRAYGVRLLRLRAQRQ